MGSLPLAASKAAGCTFPFPALELELGFAANIPCPEVLTADL